MPKYIYEALSPSGERISSEIVSTSVSEALREIEERGLSVQSIRAVTDSVELVPTNETSEFAAKLDAALERRDSLTPALEALADEMASRSAAHDIRKLIKELKRGATASELMQHESAAAWLPLIVRSISSSSSGDGFLQLMSDATRESELRSRRRRAIIYPLIVFSISLVVLVILALTIVASFKEIFQEFGLRLPVPTLLLISLSDELLYRPLQFLLSVAGVIFVVAVVVRLWWKNALTTRLLGIFVAGNSASLNAMARFTAALADLISLDLPLADALRIAGGATQHHHYRNVANALAVQCDENKPLDGAQLVTYLPANVIHALGGGGRDGVPNCRLLQELSAIYSDRASQRFDWASQLIGSVAMVIVGLVVGFVVIALFMPLVQLVTSLT